MKTIDAFVESVDGLLRESAAERLRKMHPVEVNRTNAKLRAAWTEKGALAVAKLQELGRSKRFKAVQALHEDAEGIRALGFSVDRTRQLLDAAAQATALHSRALEQLAQIEGAIAAGVDPAKEGPEWSACKGSDILLADLNAIWVADRDVADLLDSAEGLLPTLLDSPRQPVRKMVNQTVPRTTSGSPPQQVTE